MNTLTWLALYAAIIIAELTPMLKQRQRKNIIIYSAFIGVSLLISLLISLNVRLPSIDLFIGKLVISLTEK